MENTTASFQNTTELDLDVELFFPMWRRFMFFFMFLVISVCGVIGNSLVVWIVLAHKNMRTVTNLLIVNLAIADGLVAGLTVTFQANQMIFLTWPWGYVHCRLSEFVGVISICVSVLSLSVIAYDRYTAVMYPFKLRMGRGKTITILIFIWIVSAILTSPHWMVVTLEKFDDIHVCVQIWTSENLRTKYRTFFMIVTYFLPLTCMIFSYGRLGSVLWGSKVVGVSSESQAKKDLSKKKIVKMMIIVVALFTICWLPYHVINIINSIIPPHESRFEYFVLAFWFAMTNSMINPIVYCWMNARFRAGFKKAFRCCPWVKYDETLDGIHFSTVTRKSIVTTTET